MTPTDAYSRRKLLHTAAGTALGVTTAGDAEAQSADARESAKIGRLGIGNGQRTGEPYELTGNRMVFTNWHSTFLRTTCRPPICGLSRMQENAISGMMSIGCGFVKWLPARYMVSQYRSTTGVALRPRMSAKLRPPRFPASTHTHPD